jgi:dTDP-4-dehydrorhamnose reductase
LDISNPVTLDSYFTSHAIDFCINCAAYTAVDKAETNTELAYLINATAVENLAKNCQKYHTQLIHISTDYVFDGSAKHPYRETDQTNPVSIYGSSKLMGENLALQHAPGSLIIRTAWVYSSYGNNFVKTMLRLMQERDSIQVVHDQFGCPTYAADLALAIMQIIISEKCKDHPGIYHYTNTGIINWYDFAVAIKKLTGSNCTINPITTAEYPTAAKRPAYSALDNTKIKITFDLTIPDWESGLKKCLHLLA